MRSSFLPFYPPHLGQEEIDEVVDTLRSQWITTGPKTKRFEAEFAEYVGAPTGLALSSCTAGLHLSLVSLGIGPGDEVITTPMTFAATVNVIEHVGARPILVDVEPDTLNIDVSQIANQITARTRAILAVHYAGHPVDMDPLRELATWYGLPIIEDAAHAVGASYKDRMIGCGQHLTSFSFYATKNLTTAEGGMLTGPAELIERARALSLHGMSRDAWKRFSQSGHWYYEILAPGYKYNMTDIQASLGIWQLKKFPAMQQRRAAIYEQYNRAFQQVPELQIPVLKPYAQHAWHLYPLRLHPTKTGTDRDRFIQRLTEMNIGTSVHFIPVHLHPYYRDKYGWHPQDFPVANANYERLVSLPLHPWLSDEDVADVVSAVQAALNEDQQRRAA